MGRVYIPVSMALSPAAAGGMFALALHNASKVKTFPTAGWFVEDITLLAKKFVFKTVTIEKNRAPEDVPGILGDQVTKLCGDEGLNLIGGFEAPLDKKDKTGNTKINLLFFKLDVKPTTPVEIFAQLLPP